MPKLRIILVIVVKIKNPTCHIRQNIKSYLPYTSKCKILLVIFVKMIILLVIDVTINYLTCHRRQTPPPLQALQSKTRWLSPMAETVQSQWEWGRKRFRSKQNTKKNKQIDLYEKARPTWPSSAISKVSSRLPIRVTVSSAMSVMFENIASSSWLVVRSSWEYWEYCENIPWCSKIAPFVSVPWTPWWSCVDLWGRTSPTIWGLSRPPRRS